MKVPSRLPDTRFARHMSLRWKDRLDRTIPNRAEISPADKPPGPAATSIRNIANRDRFAIALNASNLEDVAKLADLHARVRGYGHVKLANLAGVKRGERDLAARLQIEAATSVSVKKSLEEMKGAGQLRGIPVVVAK